jgi:hypothetical protein
VRTAWGREPIRILRWPGLQPGESREALKKRSWFGPGEAGGMGRRASGGAFWVRTGSLRGSKVRIGCTGIIVGESNVSTARTSGGARCEGTGRHLNCSTTAWTKVTAEHGPSKSDRVHPRQGGRDRRNHPPAPRGLASAPPTQCPSSAWRGVPVAEQESHGWRGRSTTSASEADTQSGITSPL